METETPLKEQEVQAKPETTKPENKSKASPNKSLIILLVVLFLTILGLVGAIIFIVIYGNRNVVQTDNNTPTPTVVVSEIEASPTVEVSSSISPSTSAAPTATRKLATPTASPTFPPLGIIETYASANQYCMEFAGHAEYTFTVFGAIRASYPGTVTYRWMHPERLTINQTLTFTGVNQLLSTDTETVTLSIGEFERSVHAQIRFETSVPSYSTSNIVNLYLENTEAGGECI